MFLVAVEWKDEQVWDVRDSLAELHELVASAGGSVVGNGTQRLDAPVASTYIGSGKAAEFAGRCKGESVDTVVFDEELSPAQARNLEALFECKILDRTSLILDIFAQRARTREGKLQIELAQLEHLLPRLTRFWGHLSRQKGGIGMRGDGETQLETDRRRVQDRIARLQRELDEVRQHRSTQREGRQRRLWPLASIVGYTNAGKSTLLNRLTGASALAEDKLFATLDPTTRRLRLPTNQNVLLTDTVGFIKKLPHGLVEAFKATLEEVVLADLLIHVVDVSHPSAEEHILAVESVLREIGAEGRASLMVFNKMDAFGVEERIRQFRERHPAAVAVSAKTGQGVDDLLAAIGAALRPIRQLLELQIPHSEAATIARLHEIGEVVECDYDGPQVRLKARVQPHHAREFAAFAAVETPGAEKNGQ
ncbi:MAG: GTPase HflX [Verrucomicrobia bacterium]|nr:GTPase HflX [Verrucomicrobiota bacterium]